MFRIKFDGKYSYSFDEILDIFQDLFMLVRRFRIFFKHFNEVSFIWEDELNVIDADMAL